MSVSTSRTDRWIGPVIVAVSVPIAGIIGLVVFLTATSTPIHVNAVDLASVTGTAPSPQWTAAAEQSRRMIREQLVQQDLPGLSVAVGIGGDIVWTEGFGWARIESKLPVSPDMQFRIGHASKALTSAAVGLLMEQGRLDLDDEIQKYVPAFPVKQWPVTLRQLMGHVAGVRHYRDTEWGDKPSGHCELASEGLQSFAGDPLLFEPQTRSQYSTYGWILVSAAVEAAAGEPFFTFMRRQIFTPLGMADTTPHAGTEAAANQVTSYYRDNFGRELAPAVDFSCFAGAGGFLSTSPDLVRFGMAISGAKLLQPATVRMLQTRQQLASGKETDFGLGWTVGVDQLSGETTRVMSTASRMLTGASTSLLIFPERDIVVAVTSNISFADTRSIALTTAGVFAAARRAK